MQTMLANGGPVVWLLLIFSLVATTVTLVKALQLWLRLKIAAPVAKHALNHLAQGQHAQVKLLTQGNRNPKAQLIGKTLEIYARPDLTPDVKKDEATRVARSLAVDLGSYLRVLEVIASLAPLLGLFGTVLGMIEAFQAMESAGANVDPAVLSGGIWQALLTTAVGLAVAIPASLVHSWLERRVEVESLGLQDVLDRTITLITPITGIHARQSAT